MVIEDVETIKKWCQSFFDAMHSFSYRVHGKIQGKWLMHGFSAITLVNNASEANHLKGERLSKVVGHIKALNNCIKSVKGFAPVGRLLTKKWKFLPFWGPRSHPVHRLTWNFARPSGPMCPSAVPNFMWIGVTSRPCGAKMLIFDLWVNLNTG